MNEESDKKNARESSEKEAEIDFGRIPPCTLAGNYFFIYLFSSAIFFLSVLILFYTNFPENFFYFGKVADNMKYFMGYARMAADGLLPYKDVPIEYPPLAAAWLWAFAPVSYNFEVYKFVFSLAMVGWAFIGLTALWSLATMISDNSSIKSLIIKITVFYTLAIIAAGPIGIVSFDYIPMALTALALAAHCRRRPAIAMLFLAAGTAAKLYPAILFPIFFYDTFRRDGLKKTFSSAASFIFLSAVFLGIPMIFAGKGFIHSFSYHAERGIEYGSVYSAGLLVASLFGLVANPLFSHGSWNIVAGDITKFLSSISSLIMFLMLGASFARIVFVTMKRDAAYEIEGRWAISLAAQSSFLITAFIIAFKVGSPQYIGWAVPFIALLSLSEEDDKIFYTYLLVGILSQIVFPWRWEALIFKDAGTIFILLMEKALQLVVFIFLFKAVATVNSAARQQIE